MNALPQPLYPLQMLHLYLTKKNANRDLEKAVSKFIWQGKKPRLRLKVLQLSTGMSGLALPNLISNWACHAHHFWSCLNAFTVGKACVDSWACSPFCPWSLVTCEESISPDVTPVSFEFSVWQSLAPGEAIRALVLSLGQAVVDSDLILSSNPSGLLPSAPGHRFTKPRRDRAMCVCCLYRPVLPWADWWHLVHQTHTDTPTANHTK